MLNCAPRLPSAAARLPLLSYRGVGSYVTTCAFTNPNPHPRPPQVAAINTAMSSLVKTLSVFPRERVIVTRERAKGGYSTAAYLAAKLAAELPVGAVFPLLFGLLTYPLCGLNPK